jgi:hypothetical protein
MNKIHPFYILILSFALFLYSLYRLQISKNNLYQTQIENKNYTKIANKYQALQKAWGDGTNINKKIKNILQALSLKNTKFKTSKNSLTIYIKNTNIKTIHKFMNEILNSKIVILEFAIQKDNLSLKVEI